LRRYRILTLCKALAVSYHALDNPTTKNIATSTYAILLFGSPVNAGKELDSFAALSLAESDDLTEAPALKAMKRDARWLQARNQQFEEIVLQYKMTYFQESSGDNMKKLDTVSVSLPVVLYL
jgi:hypothetical protein